MKVILETDWLLLRQYVEEDAEAFFKLNSDPEVLRFVPDKRLLNVEQVRQILIDHPIADYRKHGFGRGACILKSTGEHVQRSDCAAKLWLDPLEFAFVEGFRRHGCNDLLRITESHLDEFLQIAL